LPLTRGEKNLCAFLSLCEIFLDACDTFKNGERSQVPGSTFKVRGKRNIEDPIRRQHGAVSLICACLVACSVV